MKKVLDWKFFLRVAIAIMALSVFLSAALAAPAKRNIVLSLFEGIEGDTSSVEDKLILIGLAVEEIKAMDETRFSQFMKDDGGKFKLLSYTSSAGVVHNHNIFLEDLVLLPENITKEEVLEALKEGATHLKKEHPRIYDRIVNDRENESEDHVSKEKKSVLKILLKCLQTERVERTKEIKELRKIVLTLGQAFKKKKDELEAKLETANQTIAQLQQFMLFNRTSSELSNFKIRLDQLKQLKQNVLSQAAQFVADPTRQVAYIQQGLKIDQEIQNVMNGIVVNIQRQKAALYQSALQVQKDFAALQKEKEGIDEDAQGAKKTIQALDQALAQKQSEYMSLFTQNRNLEQFAQSVEKDVYETFHPYRNVQLATEQIQAEYAEMLRQIEGGRNEYAGFNDGFNSAQTGATRVPSAQPFNGFGG
ncbi:MAG: hypothetical protein HYW47_05700 [Deltaproteobacteria bacterium]|nr:hypothetical protein [Deltaproteobacteria bacterium]